MGKILLQEFPALFNSVSGIFAEKRDELCDMDARMGDGDLGLTMTKGFAALPDLIVQNTEPGDAGKTLMKAGMKMASVVPSTMGTLMSSGMMEAGKALKGKSELGPAELGDFLTAFSAGVAKRGKCAPGDRTVLDALEAAATRASACLQAGAADLASVITAAVEGAAEGVEATKQMVPKYGKAAVFAAKAVGVPDQGAVAGLYFLMGMQRYICQSVAA